MNLREAKIKNINFHDINFEGRKNLKTYFILDVIAIIIIMLWGIIIGARMIWVAGLFIIIGLGVPMIFLGLKLLAYNELAKENRSKISKNFGEDVFQSHLNYGLITRYHNAVDGSIVLYLTDAFLYEKNVQVIDYQRIVLMTSHTERVSAGTAKVLMYYVDFYLLDGKEVHIQQGVERNNVEEIKRICLQRNPKILTNWTEQDYYNYQENVSLYKQGFKLLPELNLQMLYGPLDLNGTPVAQPVQPVQPAANANTVPTKI